MKRWMNKIAVCLMLIATMVIPAGSQTVYATGTGRAESALLYVTGYEVTNETITPGSEFTLTITLENFSSSVTAKNVMVVVGNPNGITPEYSTVSQTYLGQVGPKDTAEVSFRYTADTTIDAEELDFTAKVISDSYTTDTQIRIPVGRMVDFDVEECTVPETFVVDKTGYASAMVENLGKSGVNNVVMVARCDGKDVASANIGSISSGTSKTQSVSLKFDEEGQHTFELLLTYVDSDGINKEFVISSGLLKVISEEEQVVSDNQTQNSAEEQQIQQTEEGSGIGNFVLICISGILLIAVCCVILLLIYRRK